VVRSESSVGGGAKGGGGLSRLTSVGPPPADENYRNFRRPVWADESYDNFRRSTDRSCVISVSFSISR
jgi:hypothetical protein